jgi:phosphate transport system substrate-binding protein
MSSLIAQVAHRRPRGPRSLFGFGAVAAVMAVTLLCTSCGSSSPSGSGSTTTTSASRTVSLSSLENWPTSSVSLQETGSSLLYPLFNIWTAQIEKLWPSVAITTGSTGSGTGISAAAAGTVNIGASDAYLSPAEVQSNPGLENIPLAISAQEIDYNVPGVTGHLKLDGSVLAQIYKGDIANWDSSKIAALNPGVRLPSLPIVTLHRSDASGDTFLFTSFLSASDPSGWTISPDTTIAWPNAAGAIAAQGNGGMVQACQKNPGCIAYVGVSYQKQATSDGLGYAELQNEAGNAVLPTQAAISAEAVGYANATPHSGTVSMIYGSARSGYPIVNYEYAIVPTRQPTALAAQAVKAVLAWSIDPSGGNAPSFLNQVGFIALPSTVRQISATLISNVS